MNRQGRQSFDDSLTLAALALSLLTPNSPQKLVSALKHAGNAVNLLADQSLVTSLLKTESQQRFRDWLSQGLDSTLGQAAAQILEQTRQIPAEIIAFGSDNYPDLLAEIHSPPQLLYVRGNSSALHLPAVAIVGARQCTAQGGQNAEQFASHLAQGGFAINSGLALGIDGHTHQGALAAGGITVAVMATGIDRIYPARHKRLAEDILANNGCIISEMPLSSPPSKASFPRRNRIISGLCLGVLVVEAKIKSGSLLTAYAALKQNREVFALPGSIHNPMAKGCHQLIKEGAKLVDTTADIVQELGGSLELFGASLGQSADPNQLPINDDEHPILTALGYEAKTLDELAGLLSTPMETLLVEVLNLELEGKVSQSEGLVARLD